MSGMEEFEFWLSSFSEDKIQQKYKLLSEKYQGLTGAGTAEAISKAVSLLPGNYLEVGIYQGANFSVVASENPDKTCIGVDNFSQEFQENKRYQMSTEEVVQSRLKELNCEKNALVQKYDFREFLRTDPLYMEGDISVYFYDGPHEMIDQIDGIDMALPYLKDEAIIFVDDFFSPNTAIGSMILLDHYRNNLKFLRVLRNRENSRSGFNQGQIVMKFSRSGFNK